MQILENKNDRYFIHLDSIRFLAAMMIVILHTVGAYNDWFGNSTTSSSFGENYPIITSGFNQFIKNFGLGVDIFFLLSGFLITFILFEEKKKHGRVNIVYFMIRRSFRIWPLYFFLIAVTPFLISWLGVAKPEYWSNLLFVNNFRAIQTGLWTYPFSHFWSICIEEHFYLIWPFVIGFTPKKHLLFLFYLLIAGSIAFRFYFSDYANLYLNTLSRADVMVIGAIGAYYYSEKPFVFQLNKIVRLLLYGLLFASLTTEQFSSWETPFMAGFKKYFYMLFIGVLLLDYNFNPLLKLRLSGYKFINYLDRVSYGIYMYHNFLSVIIIKKIMYNIGSSSLPLFFTLMISFSIVIPILSYELFEKHFLKMGSKFRADPIQKQ